MATSSDRARNLEDCLKELEQHQDPTFDLGSDIQELIADSQKVLCGLRNGSVCLIEIGQEAAVIKLKSAKGAKEVTFLEWVSADRCISAHADGSCRLWDLAERVELSTLETDRKKGECEEVIALATDRAVFGSSDGNLRVWDLAQLKQLTKIAAHKDSVTCIRFVGEDKFVTGSVDTLVKVWDSHTYQELATLRGHAEAVNCLVIVNHRRCITGADDKTIRVWDLNKYREVSRLEGHTDFVTHLEAIGEEVCVSADSNSVRVWSLKNFREEDKFEIATNCWKKDGNKLFVGHDKGLTVIDLLKRKVVATVRLPRIDEVSCIGSNLACVTDNSVRFVDMQEYEAVHELLGHKDIVFGAVKTADRRLVSWSDDNSLSVWSSDHKELATLNEHSDSVNCAAVTEDGRCISGSSDKSLRVWSLSNYKRLTILKGHKERVGCVCVTANGKAISGDDNGVLLVWDLSNYSRLGTLKGHTAGIECLIVTSDETAITGSVDKTVRVWDLNKYDALVKLEGHEASVNSVVAVSGNRCVSASDDKTLKVWDLQHFSLLASLQGHTDEVWKVALVGEDRCVSGSRDSCLIVWSLVQCKQEVKLVCASPVCCVVAMQDGLFASGHENGAIVVWHMMEYRDVATFRGHSGAIEDLLVDGFTLISASADGTLRAWDLGQRSNCLSLCLSHDALEREVAERKPLTARYRGFINDFRSGKYVPPPDNALHYRPYFFNALHISACNNHSAALAKYLEEGLPLLKGPFGSPLALALERNAIECVDAILAHLIALAPNTDSWTAFQTINDELSMLLECGSSLLEPFFAVVLQPPRQKLPSFVTAPLPIVKFMGRPYFYESEVNKAGTLGDDPVKYFASLLRWTVVAGSRDSVTLLDALVNCEQRRVLLTDYFRTIIEYKWARCFPFTLSVALAYVLMNLSMLFGVLRYGSTGHCLTFLGFNCLFALYEFAQMVAMGRGYFTESWNAVDSLRSALSIIWVLLLLDRHDPDQFFTLLVVILNLIRGFTHFRTFRMTRIFVYMTFTVVAEVYSFLIILAYSVFAFGAFASVLSQETSAVAAWKKAYNLTMGNFDTAGFSDLEWVVFTGATVTNVVVMMNLLISILGEAYSKAQMTLLENDLHMQATLLLEYETLMFWKRSDESLPTWLMACRRIDASAEEQDWSGKVLELGQSLKGDFSKIEAESASHRKAAEEVLARVAGIEGKVAVIEGIGSRLSGLEGKVAEVGGQVAAISQIASKVTGIEDKVASLEGKLDSLISLLQSRS